jgi:hypothetical protein
MLRLAIWYLANPYPALAVRTQLTRLRGIERGGKKVERGAERGTVRGVERGVERGSKRGRKGGIVDRLRGRLRDGKSSQRDRQRAEGGGRVDEENEAVSAKRTCDGWRGGGVG